MTVPETNKPGSAANATSTLPPTQVHSYVRQPSCAPVSTQGHGPQNSRVSVRPTSFEGGLLVGLYDPHNGPQCADYVQQHLVQILEESLSTQVDVSDDDRHHATGGSQGGHRIDPSQVMDTLKSTFVELDELILMTAITLALGHSDSAELSTQDEIQKVQEVMARVVTGSTALVAFIAPHHPFSSSPVTTSSDSATRKLDVYLAQLGDSVALLAGLDSNGQWYARRLNPPEKDEHSVRYPASEEYQKVVVDAKEKALTAAQFLSQHNGSHRSSAAGSEPPLRRGPNYDADEITEVPEPEESFLTRDGKFLGLPVTRAFGDFDWKMEQEPRYSVSNWVEKSLRANIDKALEAGPIDPHTTSADEIALRNLSTPPYVVCVPKVSRFVIETGAGASRSSEQLLIFLNRGSLYVPATGSSTTQRHDQALMSDFELSRVAASALEEGRNAATAISESLQQLRKAHGPIEPQEEEQEKAVAVIVL
ncbi:hypothetical protein BGW38_001234 [Lunasporangiospora selenospora]|uniref:PPM-type phosphatase domain-containing protein n=1 Tax=Lunasporangiospora selenospora TaxID=979761 RepID=A0A9P6G3K9_9FUNG|nr:hypothetical protein BGW38_001234 [Lunasporangiospora selenospora]